MCEKVALTTVWILCILAGACSAALVPLPAGIVERWYSAGVYPPLQRVVTSLSNLFPFALLDVLLVVVPVTWIVTAARDVRRSTRRLRTFARWTLRTVAAAAAFYLLFLAMWGLNYRRVPLERKLHFDARAVSATSARDVAQLAVSRLNALFAEAHARTHDDAGAIDPLLAQAFARATRELGTSGTTVPARPKRTVLDLYFRPAGVSGMTNPFFLETLIESDLLPVERPFVVAHEWSHLAGFADEGEANFGGWLTCARGDAAAQYSGWLFLFGELANTVPRDARPTLIARLDRGPRDDLRAIAARLVRDVKPQVSEAGWRVYDHYLKANRVEAGTASYAQVVRLVLGTGLGLSADQSASPAR
jgi:hypothetical protein